MSDVVYTHPKSPEVWTAKPDLRLVEPADGGPVYLAQLFTSSHGAWQWRRIPRVREVDLPGESSGL